jgi:hypothetical protein
MSATLDRRRIRVVVRPSQVPAWDRAESSRVSRAEWLDVKKELQAQQERTRARVARLESAGCGHAVRPPAWGRRGMDFGGLELG